MIDKVKEANGLTLSKALRDGQLEAFIVQAEARGIGPVPRADFDDVVQRLATQPLSEDRT